MAFFFAVDRLYAGPWLFFCKEGYDMGLCGQADLYELRGGFLRKNGGSAAHAEYE
jgi:hypothetical protein